MERPIWRFNYKPIGLRKLNKSLTFTRHLGFPACWLIVFNLSLKRSILVSNCCLGKGYQMSRETLVVCTKSRPPHGVWVTISMQSSSPTWPCTLDGIDGFSGFMRLIPSRKCMEMLTCLSFSGILKISHAGCTFSFTSGNFVNLILRQNRRMWSMDQTTRFYWYMSILSFTNISSVLENLWGFRHMGPHTSHHPVWHHDFGNLKIWSLVQFPRISYSYQTYQLFHRSCLSASPDIVLFHRFLKPLRMCQ